MPVIGHAFVGLGTAIYGRAPVVESREQLRTQSWRWASWTPLVVGLAYLPDVSAHVASICGMPGARMVTHSLIAAVAVSPLVAFCLSKVCDVGRRRAFGISLISITAHDVLDLVQSTDRHPWWPLSSREVGFDLHILPTNSLAESALFGGVFIVCLAIRRSARTHPPTPQPSPAHRMIAWGLTLGIVAAASVTHRLRDDREERLTEVRALLDRADYSAALVAIEKAGRWPSAGKPGWLDYAAGECYAGLGDSLRAEGSYLRAVRRDPSYFWSAADLAVLYARWDEPLPDRRRRVAPWVLRLRTEFAEHPNLDRVLAKIDRALEN